MTLSRLLSPLLVLSVLLLTAKLAAVVTLLLLWSHAQFHFLTQTPCDVWPMTP